jgi:L-fuconolactonase
MIPAIDSHIHIWDRTRGETFIAEKQFPQLTGKAFLPDQLPDMLRSTGATQAVLVHGPSSLSHTAHCLEMANAHPNLLSVIGWINIRGGSWHQELSTFSEDPIFRGIRLMPALDPDPEGFLRSVGVLEAADALGEANQVLEVLAGPALLPAVANIACQSPQTTVCLAHFGLPTGEEAALPAWRDQLEDVSRCQNTIIKVSGLPLSGDIERDAKMTKQHVTVLLDQFGPERMCYASNWPVVTALAAPAYWRQCLDQALTELGLENAELNQILSGTARRHYSV